MPTEAREKLVDRNTVAWAKARWPSMIIRKLTTLKAHGTSGDPDRLFYWRGKLTLIEMKAPGCTSTPLQKHRQEEWRAAGAAVYECDSSMKAKHLLEILYGNNFVGIR